MTSEQSKPITLDGRDFPLFFCIFGRYEQAVVLGTIAMLSVWALFIILNRSTRGQRRRKDEDAVEAEVIGEVEQMTTIDGERCHTESTETLREEVTEVQDKSTVELAETASLLCDPGLCDGTLDKVTWPVTGEYESNAFPESNDIVKACREAPQEHIGSHSEDANSALTDDNKYKFHQKEHWKDQAKNEHEFHDNHTKHELLKNCEEHTPENQASLIEPPNNTEEEKNEHEQAEKMGSCLDDFDHDIKTERKAYADLNSQPDLNSENVRSDILEEAINDYFDDNHQCVSSQQNDLENSVGHSVIFQKKICGLDSSRNSQLEEGREITDINAVETSVKSHQEILADCQHLQGGSEHLSSIHDSGHLSSLHQREIDHCQPMNDECQISANGEIFERKMNSLDCTMTQAPEGISDKTEINIMEATMDYNEWMTGGSVESKESGTTLPLFDEDPMPRMTVGVVPAPQTVAVSFYVHYITHSALQLLAVTGNNQELGNWEKFVPLQRAKDGFWANSISIPADSHVEWKFVVVENGKIQRWEECNNRHLKTSYEEVIHLHKWWGHV
ncbi:hypothetical protein GJAV_G00041670 [Gymnothorax javanicus]|nr:hypothetical protein GJAV_G00041670 [Gymnothorax javanicus]